DIEPLLARAEALQTTVFVHPGPGRNPHNRNPHNGNRHNHLPREPSLTEPLWWAALTDYVSQMQAAWLTFATLGRRRHQNLRILFAILAAGAPLHAERLAARGGPPLDLHDPLIFYETSSYGPQMIEAMANQVGIAQLVYGSDRPVIEPPRTAHDATL